MRIVLRFIAILSVIGCVAALAFEALAIVDLFGFEYAPLATLLGTRGVLFVIVFDVGLLVFVWRLLDYSRNLRPRRPLLTYVLLALWAVQVLWLLEWMFMETPLTVSARLAAQNRSKIELKAPQAQDFDKFSLTQNLKDPAQRERFAVMYERIRVNSPDVFAAHAIGATLDKYAAQYSVDPEVLFFFAYVGSFWGEAASGPVPFLHSMTSETIRDVVQIHVPGWFIESGWRQHLVESKLLEKVAGEGLGFKLRYAFHKATLDVSTQPYDLNLFSDLMLVIQQYPAEFPEITGKEPATDPLIAALRESYLAMNAQALVAPYEDPYAAKPLDAAWYDAQRDNLKRFTRAAYYRAALDFDFATRSIALIIKYQSDYYAHRLGAERWKTIPSWEQAGMLAMTRDLYLPNVGHLGANRYALCEINCTPVEFVADQALADTEGPGTSEQRLWRPKDYTQLWGGAATKLRIFNEQWQILHREPIPGLTPESTVDAARGIIRLSPER